MSRFFASNVRLDYNTVYQQGVKYTALALDTKDTVTKPGRRYPGDCLRQSGNHKYVSEAPL